MTVQNPQYLQTKGYPAKQDRQFVGDCFQSGVIGAGDLLPAAGGGLVVPVSAGTAYIAGTQNPFQGRYRLFNDASLNVSLAASHPLYPRLDQVVARVYDSTELGSGGDGGAIEVLQGTPTVGATLDNRLGNADGAFPDNAIRLADIVVPANAVGITNANIRDRRRWARGAHYRLRWAGGDKTRTSSTYVLMDSANINPRVELSGIVPVRVTLVGDWFPSGDGAQGKGIGFDLFVDGVALGDTRFDSRSIAFTAGSVGIVWEWIPFAGSRTIGPAFMSINNVMQVNVKGGATEPLLLIIEEVVKQTASNQPAGYG